MRPGIDIVMPTQGRVAQLRRALTSLEKQGVSKDEFTIQLVVNSEELSDLEPRVRALVQEFPKLDIKLFWSSIPGVGKARNIGISMGNREYVTFLDDDDEIEPDFLKEALSGAEPSKVLVLPIVDVKVDGQEQESSLSLRMRKWYSCDVAAIQVPWVFGFNACKVVPRRFLESLQYVDSLKSGEDLVFFANLFAQEKLTVRFTSSSKSNRYRRHLSTNSVSRRASSFDFSVRQRLDCVAELEKIQKKCGLQERKAIQTIIESQIDFISRFLKSETEIYPLVVDEVFKREIYRFPWHRLTSGIKPSTLVVSYCFPPFADPSSAVIAKRIFQKRELCDAISNDMSTCRQFDNSLQILVAPWLKEHHVLSAPNYFGDWNAISKFAWASLEKFRKMSKTREYRHLCSRALWSASHVAAFLMKLDKSSLNWSAEFSDPLGWGSDGQLRLGRIHENIISKQMVQAVENFFDSNSVPRWENSFQLVELATFALADELIFTNENQMLVMLERFDSNARKKIEEKSKIVSQPVLPGYFYGKRRSPASNISSQKRKKIKIAYFGTLHKNRSLFVLEKAFQCLSFIERSVFEIHVYSDAEILKNPLGIQMHSPIPYLNYLKELRCYDLLLIVDSETKGCYPFNPFLPSKVADYLGSAVPIWAIFESQSPLSRLRVRYRSEVSNVEETLRILREILRSHSEDLSDGGVESPILTNQKLKESD